MSSLTAYRVRISARARHVSIRVSPREGVTVVIPYGFDATRIPSIVQNRRDWIEKTLRRLLSVLQPSTPPPLPASPPAQIDLPALAENWRIDYHATAATRLTLRTADGTLHVHGPIGQTAAVHALLQRWLRARAQQMLPPLLNTLSQQFGLPYREVHIRAQKNRWGSCSLRHSINLNYKLLLMPAAVVRYVLVHELCHTVHLNHGPRFWSLVEQCEPDYRLLRNELRRLGQQLPDWLRH